MQILPDAAGHSKPALPVGLTTLKLGRSKSLIRWPRSLGSARLAPHAVRNLHCSLCRARLQYPSCGLECMASTSTSAHSKVAADSEGCKSIKLDQGGACVNQASAMDSQTAQALRQLLSVHENIDGFRNACPLTEALDGDASQ